MNLNPIQMLCVACCLLFLTFQSCQQQYDCPIDSELLAKNDTTLLIRDGFEDGYFERLYQGYDELYYPGCGQEGYRYAEASSMPSGLKFVTIYREGRKSFLEYKEYWRTDRRTGESHDSLYLHFKKQIPGRRWREMKVRLDANCFWTMECDQTRPVLDGTTRIVEANRPKGNTATGRKYHAVFGNTNHNANFDALCQSFYDLLPDSLQREIVQYD